MGTRFVASTEAFVHPDYQQRVAKGTAADTVYSQLFDVGWPGAPHRVLRNRIVQEWEAAGRPPSGQRAGERSIIGVVTRLDGTIWEVPKYATMDVTPNFKGDIEQVPLWAGESCSLVNGVKPAGEIVRDVVRGAEDVIAQFKGL
jgi:NAD(P)H-dependent flavin oxidoreductase YrpB (nitropropane dioxygenase family)